MHIFFCNFLGYVYSGLRCKIFTHRYDIHTSVCSDLKRKTFCCLPSNRSETDRRRVTEYDFSLEAMPMSSSARFKDRFVEEIGRGASPLLEICKLTPVKIFFCTRNTSTVPRNRRAGASIRRVRTRRFTRGQTPHHGLPGNCWKHLASVYNVIEARSHLARAGPVSCHEEVTRSLKCSLKNFEYRAPGAREKFQRLIHCNIERYNFNTRALFNSSRTSDGQVT